MDYGKEIAGRASDIGAISLRPKDPFLWASGFHMPIYNDNRKLLSTYSDRMLVAEGLKSLVETYNIRPDVIAGTSTAGIAPASSLAQLLNLPLVIQNNGRFYEFPIGVLTDLSVCPAVGIETDIIVSTCPFAIPSAVMDANRRQLPFAYVRAERKDHGHKKQIEGIVTPGQYSVLIDFHVGDSYADIAVEALKSEDVEVRHVFKEEITDLFLPVDLSGKTIVQVEDLVSTSKSCVEEIKLYKAAGASVSHCLAIFSYGLDKALQGFEAENVTLLPVLTYPTLLEVALAKGNISSENLVELQEWRKDPFGWGERHGFLPKKK